ncbi:MAG: sugar phosphate isomerase/epimerase family protein [Candidatus Poribacteria bacterium]
MAFKLGYSSLKWREPNLPELLGQLKATGWEGWELRQSLDFLGSPERVRKICDDAEMPVAVVTARGISLDKNSDVLKTNKRRIDFAAALEADCFMFMGAGKPQRGYATDEEISALAEVGDEMADYASQYNLDVCYHIHTNTTVDSTEEWAKLMSKMEKCKLCIDVSHSALWGFNPRESVKHYQDRLIYIHLQDYDTEKADDWVELGEGNILDFPGTLKALGEIGYDRWVTVCPGNTDRTDEEKMRVNREYLRSLGY